MTMMNAHALPEFRANDNVRLLRSHGDVPSGALGRILGRFAREVGATYVVSFEGDKQRIARDVCSSEIVLADDVRAPA
jgi:hypothetical protein